MSSLSSVDDKRAQVPDSQFDALRPTTAQEPDKPSSLFDKAVGVGEAGLSLGTGAVIAPVWAAIRQGINIATNGKYGTQEGVKEAADARQKAQEQATYSPRTATGQDIVRGVGELAAPLEGLGPQNELLSAAASPGAANLRAVAAAPINVAKAAVVKPTQAVLGIAPKVGATIAARVEDAVAAQQARAGNVARMAAAPPGGNRGKIDEALKAAGDIGTPGELAGDAAKVFPETAVVKATQHAATTSAENTPGAMATDIAHDLFPDHEAPVDRELPILQQQERARALAKVFGPDAKLRDSAITGDMLKAKTDLDVSRIDSPQGALLKQRIADERRGVRDFIAKSGDETGGRMGSEEHDRYARGAAQADAIDAYREHFDKATSALYSEARERADASGTRVQLTGTKQLLADPEFEAKLSASPDGQALLGSLKKIVNVHEAIGEKAAPGVGGVSVSQSEQLRKFMNSDGVYTPQRSGILRDVKQAIDKDVFGATGEDLFDSARKMHQLRAITLDNPNGIRKIFEVDPELSASGDRINRAKSLDKISEAVAKLDPDQYRNVVKTLRNAPSEIQPQAQAALQAMKAHHFNRVAEIAAGKTDESIIPNHTMNGYLRDNSMKLAELFSDKPAELQKLRDVARAANILRIDPNYVGAGVQTENILRRGAATALEHTLSGAGATVGGAIGSLSPLAALSVPAAATTGAKVGSAIQNVLKNTRETNKAKRSTIRLSEFPGVREDKAKVK